MLLSVISLEQFRDTWEFDQDNQWKDNTQQEFMQQMADAMSLAHPFTQTP